MLDAPTLRLPITRISPEAMRALRRRVRDDHARQHDLERTAPGMPALDDRTALEIAARMSARPNQSPDEHETVRELMRRHGLTAPQIVAEQRRAAITRKP